MRSTRWSAVAIASVVLAGSAVPSAAAARDERSHEWFTAWSRPQSLALAAAADPLDGGRGPGPLVDQSVRNVVRVTASGTALRLRLSNRYGPSLQPDGTTPLRVLAGSVALRAAGPAVVPASLRTVTFGGRRDVTITPGATVLSDPVPLPVR